MDARLVLAAAVLAAGVVREYCMTSVVAVTGPDQGSTREG
jgi:hypothetical protein